MAQYNFLSGSTIDNITSSMFDALKSGECYLGFSKGSPKNQWGINALISIEQTAPDFPGTSTKVIAVSGDLPTENIFYDNNSMLATNSGEDKRLVKIVKYLKPYTVVSPAISVSAAGADANLKLVNLNKSWALIQGLDKNFMTNLHNDPNYDLYDYYILPATSDDRNIQLKINKKMYTDIPFYISKVKLTIALSGSVTYSTAISGIEKESNMLGETFVKGLTEDSLSAYSKSELVNATFRLVDQQNGSVIFTDMKLVDPSNLTSDIFSEVTSYDGTQKFITLKYLYVDGRYQYIKLIVGNANLNSLAIWNEELPYDSIIPTADSNPPALDITYLKNPLFHSSIFDVNGLARIDSNDVKFVKEVSLPSDISYYTDPTSGKGFTLDSLVLTGEKISHVGIVSQTVSAGTATIPLYDDHTFIVGDQLYIPYDPNIPLITKLYSVVTVSYENNNSYIILDSNLISNMLLLQNGEITSIPTENNANVSLITTTDKDKALLYGLSNVMITKTDIPRTGALSPTDNIYRQLFISYRPRTGDEGVIDSQCTADVYNGDAPNKNYGANFNINKWTYDVGLVYYVANKIPVYRKWANQDETFKIIL